MPGSWEIKQARRLLLGILHTESTSIAWAMGLRALQIPGHIMPVSGMPYDMARNEVARACLANDFTWLGFLDSDVIPPPDAFLRLLAHNKPVISGLYCRRSPPHAIPVMIRNDQWVTSFPANKVISVDLVGAGCMVVHRSVLEALQDPPDRPAKRWFDWKADLKDIKPKGEALSEDFAFCKRVREELNIPILVDTSIQCKHVGLAEATFARYEPLNHAA